MLATLTRLAAVQGSIVGRIITGRWTWVRDVEIKLKTRQLAKRLPPSQCLYPEQNHNPFPILWAKKGARQSNDFLRISGRQIQSLVRWLFWPQKLLDFFAPSWSIRLKGPRPSIHPSGVLSVWLEFSCLRANSCCYFKFYFAVPVALEQP